MLAVIGYIEMTVMEYSASSPDPLSRGMRLCVMNQFECVQTSTNWFEVLKIK